MKRSVSICLIIIMLFSLVACDIFTQQGGGTSDTTTSTDDTSSSGTTGGSLGGEPDLDGFDKDELQLFYDLFDHNNHISLSLDISDAELKKLQQDYDNYNARGSKSPIYRMADLYVTIRKPNGETLEYKIEQVGVRMKGNMSRTSFYSDEDGMYNLIHFKVDFGQTFDDAEYYGDDALVWADKDARKARKNRTFATLEKIDMKWNRNDDATYIRETYAYDIYRELGVLAPHTNLASVDIGDDHAGVWTFYEPIDKIFLQKNLPEAALGGDLYKLGWTQNGATFTSFSEYGVEDEDSGAFYIYDLKTNKKTSDHSSLKSLINTINSSLCTKDSFSSVVDIDNFLTYCAASYIIGNPDDLRNNYNNTYIYFRADTGKVVFIPYDMDRGLGINDWNPYGNGMTTDSPFQSYNACGEQRNPLFKKTISEGGFLMKEYVEALKSVSENEMFTAKHFEARYEIARALYQNETAPSKKYNNAQHCSFTFDINETCSPSDSANMSFSDYISAKLKTMNEYIDSTVIVDPTDPVSPTPKPDSKFDLYIRATFTDWNVRSEYSLKCVSEGVFSIELTRDSEFQFKIYDNDDQEWYGADAISGDCSASYGVEADHGNIILPSGSYTIYFYADTREIDIQKK